MSIPVFVKETYYTRTFLSIIVILVYFACFCHFLCVILPSDRIYTSKPSSSLFFLLIGYSLSTKLGNEPFRLCIRCVLAQFLEFLQVVFGQEIVKSGWGRWWRTWRRSFFRRQDSVLAKSVIAGKRSKWVVKWQMDVLWTYNSVSSFGLTVMSEDWA